MARQSRRRVEAFPRAAWLLTSAAFTACGLSRTAQLVFACTVLRSNGAQGPMRAYVKRAPAFGHSRSFLLLGFFVSLAALSLLGGEPGRRFWWGADAALGGGLLFGAWLGVLDGSLGAYDGLSLQASWTGAELVMVATALLALVLTSRADRHVWGALAVYGLILGMSWVTDLGLLPALSSSFAAARFVLYACMAAFAVRRLLLARRGVLVPGLAGQRCAPPWG